MEAEGGGGWHALPEKIEYTPSILGQDSRAPGGIHIFLTLGSSLRGHMPRRLFLSPFSSLAMIHLFWAVQGSLSNYQTEMVKSQQSHAPVKCSTLVLISALCDIRINFGTHGNNRRLKFFFGH